MEWGLGVVWNSNFEGMKCQTTFYRNEILVVCNITSVDTGLGHPVVLYYKIHNVCSYSQTQLLYL